MQIRKDGKAGWLAALVFGLQALVQPVADGGAGHSGGCEPAKEQRTAVVWGLVGVVAGGRVHHRDCRADHSRRRSPHGLIRKRHAAVPLATGARVNRVPVCIIVSDLPFPSEPMIAARLTLPLLAILALPLPAVAQTADTAVLRQPGLAKPRPQRGGRSVAAAGSAARPNEYYMGTTGGGVFKTVDGGDTWAPVSDRFFGGTIGAIAVSESNPDIVYVGGGEFPIRGNVSHGDGVYKSTDAGKTWTYVGLVETRQISKIRIHPGIPTSSTSRRWARSSGRARIGGSTRPPTAGKTWNRILFRNDTTGAIDLTMDPHDPETLYAGLWTAYRKPWQLVSGGSGSGIFKTTDGGRTWKELTRNPGMPAGIIGNIGVVGLSREPAPGLCDRGGGLGRGVPLR